MRFAQLFQVFVQLLTILATTITKLNESKPLRGY